MAIEARAGVTAAYRVDDENHGHMRISIFVGRRRGSRGRSGVLTVRTDEWPELRLMLGKGGFEQTK